MLGVIIIALALFLIAFGTIVHKSKLGSQNSVFPYYVKNNEEELKE